jgi:hypothetical protein
MRSKAWPSTPCARMTRTYGRSFPAHLLLQSGVAPDYLCGALVWWATDYCRAARVDKRLFAQVGSTLLTYV